MCGSCGLVECEGTETLRWDLQRTLLQGLDSERTTRQ